MPPIHPGEVLLKEFLEPMGISQNKLARDLNVPAQRVSDVVHGRRAVTVDTAARLARYFGTTPQFWLNIQMGYELEVARDKLLFERVAREVREREASAA